MRVFAGALYFQKVGEADIGKKTETKDTLSRTSFLHIQASDRPNSGHTVTEMRNASNHLQTSAGRVS